MCVQPGILPTGEQIGCRKCWQCRERKINDWVGRCIAENKTAAASTFVTLTYGYDPVYGSADHERAAVLTYSDVQKYIKRLRRAGFPLRYFAVGEYGSLKGRAHWHLILYWLKKPPEFTLGVRCNHSFWNHGFSQFDAVTPHTVRYLCKYLQKDIGSVERQGHLAMSKKPPLGAEYFRRLARRYVDQWLAPQDGKYTFAECVDKQGEKVQFMLSGVSELNFVQSYVEQWEALRGKTHAPFSEYVETVLAKTLTERTEFTLPEMRRWKMERPWLAPPSGATMVFSETHNTYKAAYADGVVLYWSYDREGNRAWTTTIASGVSGEKSVLPLNSNEFQNEYRKQSGRLDGLVKSRSSRRRLG